jgi:hypothetical protein
MFGLSLLELLVIAALVALVWYAIRRRGRRRAPSESEPGGDPPVEDMVKCPVCGDFVPARSPASCGRDDCPYRA